MEGERASARDPQQGSREEVLAAVLLHVVAAPLPVDDAGDSFFIRRSFQYVNHVVALLVDARHADPGEGAQVARLAARLRVKVALVQNHPRAPRRFEPANDARFENGGVRIDLVRSGASVHGVFPGCPPRRAATRARSWLRDT